MHERCEQIIKREEVAHATFFLYHFSHIFFFPYTRELSSFIIMKREIAILSVCSEYKPEDQREVPV